MSKEEKNEGIEFIKLSQEHELSEAHKNESDKEQLLDEEEQHFETHKPSQRKQKVNKIIFFALIFLTNIYWYILDKTCELEEKSDSACVRGYLLPNLGLIFKNVAFASLLIACQIFMIMFNKEISNKYYFLIIANVALIVSNWDFSNQDYHAIFNTLFLIILTMILLSFAIFYFIYRLIKTQNQKFRWVSLVVIACLGIFYTFHVLNSCKNWKYGVDGITIIDNSDEYCKINEPKICAYELTDGLLNFYWWQDECSKQYGSWERLSQWLPTNGRYIVWPRTEHFIPKDRFIENTQEVLLEQAFNVNSLDDPRVRDNEIFIDIEDKEYPKQIIDVKRNETLVNERKQKAEEYRERNKGYLPNNYLAIYIDALSRAQVQRSMKKTTEWLKKRMFKIHENSTNHEFVEFMRYHSVGPFTTDNWNFFQFGQLPNITEEYLNEEVPPKHSMVNDLKQNGFITARAADYNELTPIVMHVDSIKQLKEDPYDHEGSQIGSDPNYQQPDYQNQYFWGPFSASRRCLYGKEVCEHTIEYGRQFWQKYHDQNKFLLLDFIDAHEATLQIVKFLDVHIANFLEELDEKGQLDDTMIILFSDHGQHLHFVYESFETQQFFAERPLPTFFLGFPTQNTDKKLVQNAQNNSQSLIWALDIHYFFKGIAYGRGSKYLDKSMLSSQLPKGRTCKDMYLSANSMDFCGCY